MSKQEKESGKPQKKAMLTAPSDDLVTIAAPLADQTGEATHTLRINVGRDVFNRVVEVLSNYGLVPEKIIAEAGKKKAVSVVIFTVAAVTTVGIIVGKKIHDNRADRKPPAEKKLPFINQYTQEQQREFSAMYDSTHRQILSYIKSMIRDDGIAEELLQDTYIRAFKNLDTFMKKPDAANPYLSWLFVIAKHVVINYVNRKIKPANKYESFSLDETRFEDAQDDHYDTLADREAVSVEEIVEDTLSKLNPQSQVRKQAIENFLAAASDRDKLILWLKLVENLSNRQISYILGSSTTVGAVKSAYHRLTSKINV